MPHSLRPAPYDDLPRNPLDWTPEDIMWATPSLLCTEDKIRQALARFQFNVVRIEQLPVHRLQIVGFTGRDKMGLYPRSLGQIIRDALLYYELDFDEGSLIVNALGRQGRVVFISHEALVGNVPLD